MADSETSTRTTEAGTPPGHARAPAWRRLLPLAVLLAAMVAGYAAGVTDYLSLDAIIRHHDALRSAVADNWLASAAAYLGLYAVAVALSFPGASLITIVGGFLFGAVAGTALTVVAATFGASVIFLAARTSLGGVLRRRAGRFAQRFADGFEDNAFSYLLFLRLVPLFPFWLINVAPALFDVRLGTYVAATALGIVPGTIAYTLVGDGLGGLIAAQERANPGCAEAGTCEVAVGALFTPGLIAAIVALSAAALIPVVVKRWRAARAAS